MNLRKHIYLTLNRWRGFHYPQTYRQLIKQQKSVLGSEVRRELLTKILRHCQNSFLYYTKLMGEDYRVNFDFVDDIQVTLFSKYRFLIL